MDRNTSPFGLTSILHSPDRDAVWMGYGWDMDKMNCSETDRIDRFSRPGSHQSVCGRYLTDGAADELAKSP
jgi:hypothetical protein